jgi:hypothetical protein
VREVEVKVPVRMPCEAPDIPVPVYPFDGAKVTMDLDDKTKLLLADRLVRQGEVRELRAALDGCRK